MNKARIKHSIIDATASAFYETFACRLSLCMVDKIEEILVELLLVKSPELMDHRCRPLTLCLNNVGRDSQPTV